MALINLNPLFTSLRGSVKELTLRTRVDGRVVASGNTRPVTPAPAIAQRTMMFSRANLFWQTMSALPRTPWEKIGIQERFSGKNAMIQASLNRLYGYSYPLYVPNVSSIPAFPSLSASPGPASGQITFTWNGSTWTDLVYLYVLSINQYGILRCVEPTAGIIDARSGTATLDFPTPRINWVHSFTVYDPDRNLFCSQRAKVAKPLA